MGFESVLHFRIESVPSILAFSLLKSFDEKECKINLNNGKSITITEEDVELVYGFPRGDITYSRDKWKSNAPFMREIAEQCETKPGNVNHKAVEQLMLADRQGGTWFKRMFLVLLESALIEPSTCGMIKSKIGEVIDDLDNVRNINWCSYTISVLKFAMENWSKTEKNAFAGPLPFLMLCYLDRVTQDKRPVPRTFPLMKGWKSEHLQAREDKEISEGVFGLGRIKKRYVRTLEQEEEEKQEEEEINLGSSQNLLPKDFMQNVVKNIHHMNYGKINLVRTLKEAPSHIKTNFLFGLVCDMARSAVGSQTTSIESVGEKFQHLSKTFLQDKPDTFDNWKTISESIIIAEKEKEALEDLTEFPTFKFGHLFDEAAEEEEVEGTKEDTVGDDNSESASPISPPAAGPMDDAHVETNKEKQQEKGKEKEENIVKVK